ncbi:TIGR04076 family protein [Streptosporangium sp. NPDC051022]|uniref:TIGR04076 family protein n=1 Tax=Streptosporangium sp. NPDC051022 TaxID=3155752 RepID=UPI0034263542
MTAPRVRVVVERAAAPRCGLAVGDSFEVEGPSLTLPEGRPFCLYAMAAVFPVLDARLSELPADHWLERKPYICCPDPADAVLMRLERVDRAEATGAAKTGGTDGAGGTSGTSGAAR